MTETEEQIIRERATHGERILLAEIDRLRELLRRESEGYRIEDQGDGVLRRVKK